MWPFWPKRNKPARRERNKLAKRESNSITGNSASPYDVQLGSHGEKLAAGFLKKAGLKILARNYRCPAGEADLIALDKSGPDDVIVFVEVKTRSSDKYTVPESAVNSVKQQKLRGIAEYYLATHKTGNRGVRFDVVSIVFPPAGQPEVRHIPEAF